MAIATGVYDHKPVPDDENNLDADFPYVVIGEDDATQVDTDDTINADHISVIHTWSRYRGLKEIKQMQQAIKDALHRQPLTVANAVYTDGYLEMEENFVDSDGLTRHGVQRFISLLDGV